ncbi:LEAF RUST 10 DISEASE-RESISTANCE LOCUS RECEPTOR-LIKE PROTEIN KINASE-like 1.4 isoform X2 [Eucalyptus grandis]|uniref:LEAF RUST 10 DISEASE-RESISTANCE LOCUS RECEPTOR-LIKE PROTEIN KINASE-like 1.4 isoform X2 n=1 Tax=Eucalyptus grandis TaxID=71139 RepID=UPI00192EE0D1|nr:LEAF RUST 10 DISEASE-RESISTANCE LOCUS RECEPTOR-LIKE PROTEIN KINASE-like 1.4 isoform X2 [Eucalyptus grandis]
MNTHLLLSCTMFLVVMINMTQSQGKNELYSNCSNLFNCGNIQDVGFPFYGGNRSSSCGHPALKLACEDNAASITISSVKYKVLNFSNSTEVLQIAREDFSTGICSPKFTDTTLDPALFSMVDGYINSSFIYGCPNGSSQYSCTINGTANKNVYVVPLVPGAMVPGTCFRSVVFPISQAVLNLLRDSSSLKEIVQQGFEVKLEVDSAGCTRCAQSKGVCGYDISNNSMACYCPDGSFESPTCSPPAAGGPQGSQDKVSLKVGLFLAGAAIAGLLLGFWIFSYIQKRKGKRAAAAEAQSKSITPPPSSKGLPISSTNFSRTTPSYPTSKSDLDRGSTYFGVQVFNYTELEEATQNFDPSRELGEGGFGTVYYGRLQDGREVAVKRLFENNLKRVEQFMNEVEILTRLRHPNLVTLFGCTSRRSRELLLVYEYIPNGTMADHLFGKSSSTGPIPWRIRLNMAIESADALAYLHKSDVIHRDVKTNNILLDHSFRVKVADFGLSRLFPTDVTHVSTAPQGTPGYVDPEYYQCYQLTDKSDVYSFGVVLCELISSKPAVDTNRHRHDINLASMAVNKIQNHSLHELVDPALGYDTDYSVKRMTTLVAELAFRCLQQERDMRPTMEEVAKALKEIEQEEITLQNAEVVDIRSDDTGLLKNFTPPFSPESVVTDKWVSDSAIPNSF